MNYKVGDKVEIIKSRSGGINHYLIVGSVAEIVDYNPSTDYYELKGKNSTLSYLGEIIHQSVHEDSFKLINTNSKMTTNQTMKDATLDVATKLLKANNTVTTLEVKTNLRKDYPHFRWKQHTDVSTGVPGVSELMAELEVDGELAFTDSGLGYRIYSLAGSSYVIPQPATPVTNVSFNPPTTTTSTGAGIAKVINVKKVKKTPTKAKSISKAKALDLIQNSKGHFFKVVFIKKEDGSERTLNGQYVKGQTVSPLGLVRVKESSLMKKLKKTGDINTIPSKSVIRSFNINNLKTLGIAGQNYKIRK